jgi:hypothetical protein
LTVLTEPEPPQVDGEATRGARGVRGKPADGQAHGQHQPGCFLRPHEKGTYR